MTEYEAMFRALVRDEMRKAGLTAPARAVTIREAAERLSVHPKSVRRLIQTGELRAVRVGSRSLRVRSSDVDALLDGGAS